jgi:Protein of unknown function (DUF1131)
VHKSPPFFLLAAIVATLAGCADSLEGDQLANAATSSRPDLVITAEGVPGLPAGSPYSEAAIESAMPGFDASPITMATATREQAALALFRDGLQVVQVSEGGGGRIGAVYGVSDRVRGPAGERIGMTLKEARINPASCQVGTGNWRGMPLCPSPAAPNVTLAFSVPGYMESSALPGPDQLEDATLQRIIWTPSTP